jgi:putative Mn2+ efflux pump MntP
VAELMRNVRGQGVKFVIQASVYPTQLSRIFAEKSGAQLKVSPTVAVGLERRTTIRGFGTFNAIVYVAELVAVADRSTFATILGVGLKVLADTFAARVGGRASVATAATVLAVAFHIDALIVAADFARPAVRIAPAFPPLCISTMMLFGSDGQPATS